MTGQVLVGKWNDYEKMQNGQVMNLLPKMERMWGWEGEEQSLSSAWNNCQDIDYEEVTKMNQENMDTLAVELFKSSRIEKLNTDGSSLESFTELVTAVSQCAFLTLSGMTARPEEGCEFEAMLRATGADKPTKKTKFN